MFSRLLFLTFLIFSLGFDKVESQTIYSWKDESGVTHYSSRAEHPKARLANLPKITRLKFKSKAKTIKRVDSTTCDQHGGVNCQAGPDSDGSVICLDGFRKAVARFRFSCSMARLRIADVSFDNTEQIMKVLVRNQLGVEAKDVEVYYMAHGRKRFDLEGPFKLSAYTVEEFRLPIRSQDLESDKSFKTRVYVRCMNCS